MSVSCSSSPLIWNLRALTTAHLPQERSPLPWPPGRGKSTLQRRTWIEGSSLWSQGLWCANGSPVGYYCILTHVHVLDGMSCSMPRPPLCSLQADPRTLEWNFWASLHSCCCASFAALCGLHSGFLALPLTGPFLWQYNPAHIAITLSTHHLAFKVLSLLYCPATHTTPPSQQIWRDWTLSNLI